MCNSVPPERPGPAISAGLAAGKALFTDYTYDNLGIPKNPAFGLPPLNFNMIDVDKGLGDFCGRPREGDTDYERPRGRRRRPLQGVDPAQPHAHGALRPQRLLRHAQGHRALLQHGRRWTWPAPEVPVNVNRAELGNLGLTAAEEDAIVAFLKTLTDRVVVTIPIH